MILEDVKLDFDDVLIRPKRSTIVSRNDVDITRKFKTKWSCKELEGFPLIASNMYNIGTIECAKVMGNLKAYTTVHKFYNSHELFDILHYDPNTRYEKQVFVSIGESIEDLNRIKKVYSGLDYDSNIMICYDVANCYRESSIDFVKRLREFFPFNVIMAGNVCTADITDQLIMSGADIVKVGIGPSKSCDTRIATGVGYPQLSAILECKEAAHANDGLICSDGGCKNYGDVSKAFAAGADFVMVGNLLAGTDTNCGDWEYEPEPGQVINIFTNGVGQSTRLGNMKYTDKKKRIKIYGMSSKEAQEKHNGGFKDYRAPEGNSRWVDYKGTTESVVKEIMGGVRSTCSYVGARRLKDLNKCCTFVRVNRIK